jgi:hypothetical protein
MKLKDIPYEIFFLFLVIISFAEIFGFASGEISILKKILSWVLIGYLLYHISITRIIFGRSHRVLDIAILASFYLFALKDFSHFILIEEHLQYLEFVKPVFQSPKVLTINKLIFFSSYITMFILAIISSFFSYSENSIMGVIRGPREHRSWKARLLDLVIIFLIFLFFSYFIFAIVMEWFALALDSYVVVGALVYYIVVYYILHNNREYVSITHLVVNTGDKLIESFLGLFRSRRTIFFGLSGIIVIHSLIDLFNFIFPYLLNLKNTLYLAVLPEEGHSTVIHLFFQDFSQALTIFDKIVVSFIYLQNIIAIFLLLFIPFFIWSRIFNRQQLSFTRFQLALFGSCLITFVLSPIFRISRLMDFKRALVGADILTQQIAQNEYLPLVLMVSVLWFMIILFMGGTKKIKTIIEELFILVSLFFLGTYIFNFYTSTLQYNLAVIKELLFLGDYLLMFCIIVYMAVTSIFYIAGFILFVAEVLQSEHISFFRLKEETRKEIIFIWAVLLTVLMIYLINSGQMLLLSMFIMSSLILSLVLFRYDRPSAVFILFVSIILILFSMTGFITYFIQRSSFIELIVRMVVFVVIIGIAVVSRTRFYTRFSLRRLLAAIVFGGLFGFWFSFLKEPKPDLFSGQLWYLVFFSLLIALNEELIFRKLLFRFSKHIYSIRYTLIVQAMLFCLLHLMDIVYLWNYYSLILLGIYSLSIMVFGLVMGLLAETKGEKISPIYPIIAHTISNLVLFL